MNAFFVHIVNFVTRHTRLAFISPAGPGWR